MWSYFHSQRTLHLPVRLVKRLIAISASPQLVDMTFFAHCNRPLYDCHMTLLIIKKWLWNKIDARNGKSVMKLVRMSIFRPLAFTMYVRDFTVNLMLKKCTDIGLTGKQHNSLKTCFLTFKVAQTSFNTF